jgi:hypothetical protein
MAVEASLFSGGPLIVTTGLTGDMIKRRRATVSKQTESVSELVFDLGHQGDVDYTQILQCLRLTPTERLDRHESWRLFAKEALRNAEKAALELVQRQGPSFNVPPSGP